jgi:hypothetical protein
MEQSQEQELTVRVSQGKEKSMRTLPTISVQEPPSAIEVVYSSESIASDRSRIVGDEKMSSTPPMEDEKESRIPQNNDQSTVSTVLRRRMTFATSGTGTSSTFTSLRRTLSEETK